MDFLNSIKEWFSGLLGDSVSSATESLPNVEELQQHASDATNQVTDVTEQASGAVEDVKSNIPGQQ